MKIKVVVIGAGGQARVVGSILRLDPKIEIVAYLSDSKRSKNEKIFGKAVKKRLWINRLLDENVNKTIIALGDNRLREKLFNEMVARGFDFITAIHPTANISPDSTVGKGSVVAQGAIICTCARIGDNSIINSGAIVEHEDIIGKNVHVGPGVKLAGRVKIGDNSFVGIGAIVKDYITIGKNVIIGAGSVVIDDIEDNTVVAGVPAKVIKKNTR